MFDGRRILVLAPHTDDAELGLGGTLSRISSRAASIDVVAFSVARESLLDGFASDVLVHEMRGAMAECGLSTEQLHILDYPVRRFPEVRQEILERLVVLRRDLQPDIVFVPSRDDVHQDHQVVCAEGLRAFRQATILGYELPWNHFESSPALYVRLDENNIAGKLRMLQHYESQIAKQRAYFRPESVEALARFRGVQAGCEFAEAFDVYRLIV